MGDLRASVLKRMSAAGSAAAAWLLRLRPEQYESACIAMGFDGAKRNGTLHWATPMGIVEIVESEAAAEDGDLFVKTPAPKTEE